MGPEMADWEVWVRSTGLSQFVLNHGRLWPVLETIHFTGLSLLLGTVGLYDLRVMGVAKPLPPSALHRLVPFGVAGFAMNLITGVMFFAGYPDQYAYNGAFRVKLVFLAIAAANVVLCYTAAFRGVRGLGAGADAPALAKTSAAISLVAWIGVLVCGRLLTFYRPIFFH